MKERLATQEVWGFHMSCDEVSLGTIQTMEDQANLERKIESFGKKVLEFRLSKNLYQADVYANGGPSDKVQQRIEAGKGPAPTRGTLEKYDAGLSLRRGSAAAAFHHGADLEEDDGVESSPLTFRQVQVDVEVVLSIFAAHDSCIQLCHRSDLPESAAEIAQRVEREIKTAGARLSAAYATDVLERAGGPDRELPNAIEVAYREFLTAPPPDATGAERDDQLYRRWLAHRATDLESTQLEYFTARWRAKLDQIRLSERSRR
ncbi:hypothetical protein CRH09_03230 [Nocardia terpenica]|uniref:Uncharacterized protein n=2 Tax=Nocardia terpenica TaxID=455432 RepID=A0A291RE24_9NOCA|nr:hypothetical protein CRH09_03230 [Nocardia terpenica]